MKILSTDIIKGQEYYPLPEDAFRARVEVYNRKKKVYEKRDFTVYLKIHKNLKTDNNLTITY